MMTVASLKLSKRVNLKLVVSLDGWPITNFSVNLLIMLAVPFLTKRN